MKSSAQMAPAGILRAPSISEIIRQKGSAKLALLGASGSIGQQCAELFAKQPNVQICLISGGQNAAALQNAANLLRPQLVLAASEITSQISAPKVLAASELASALAAMQPDGIINATSGFAGLEASLLAAQMGCNLYLANKESLVIASHLLQGARINPIDSEHSALQSLLAGAQHVKELIITASGGAFYATPLDALAAVTPAQALKHPNWSMGAKITIDSATMVNKLYELAEARALFSTCKISAFIERSSIIHALVRCCDESVRAYASAPDMKLAIASSLFGEADFAAAKPLCLSELAALKFEPICEQRYALWALRHELLARPEIGVVLNAADEAAVGAFLRAECGYLDISRAVMHAVNKHAAPKDLDYAALCELDSCVRAHTQEALRTGQFR